jgi:hypothetical protein
LHESLKQNTSKQFKVYAVRSKNMQKLSVCTATGLCDKPVNVSSFLAQRSASGDQCHRIWCSDQLHWVLAAFTVLLAIGLKSWLSRQEKVEQSKKVEAEFKRQESPRELQFQGGDHQTAPLLEIPPGGTAVAPEIPTSAGDGAIRRSSKTIAVTSEALVNSSENIQNTKEVEISLVASETNSLKESKEIDLPASGDKYPLGLARHLGWFSCRERCYTLLKSLLYSV